MIAVSYTHLDVYKRQIWCLALIEFISYDFKIAVRCCLNIEVCSRSVLNKMCIRDRPVPDV